MDNVGDETGEMSRSGKRLWWPGLGDRSGGRRRRVSSGIYLDARSYQLPGLLRKKRSQEPRIKGRFSTPEMKRLTASPEASQKKGVT